MTPISAGQADASSRQALGPPEFSQAGDMLTARCPADLALTPPSAPARAWWFLWRGQAGAHAADRPAGSAVRLPALGIQPSEPDAAGKRYALPVARVPARGCGAVGSNTHVRTPALCRSGPQQRIQPSESCLTELGGSGQRRLSVGGAIQFLPTPVASSEAVGTGEDCRHPLLRHTAVAAQAARGCAASVGFRRASCRLRPR